MIIQIPIFYQNVLPLLSQISDIIEFTVVEVSQDKLIVKYNQKDFASLSDGIQAIMQKQPFVPNVLIKYIFKKTLLLIRKIYQSHFQGIQFLPFNVFLNQKFEILFGIPLTFTLNYLPPEFLFIPINRQQSSDVWAFGILSINQAAFFIFQLQENHCLLLQVQKIFLNKLLKEQEYHPNKSNRKLNCHLIYEQQRGKGFVHDIYSVNGDPKLICVLNSIFKWSPNSRPEIEDLLNDPYLEDLSDLIFIDNNEIYVN